MNFLIQTRDKLKTKFSAQIDSYLQDAFIFVLQYCKKGAKFANL